MLNFFLDWVDVQFPLTWWLGQYFGGVFSGDPDMHLRWFDLGWFITLDLVEVVLVGWFGWVVVYPRELGVHVCLAPPEYCPVGWVSLYFGWVLVYFHCPWVYGPGFPIRNCRNALIWVSIYAFYILASSLVIITDLRQLSLVSANSLSVASRVFYIRGASTWGRPTVTSRYCYLMSSRRCLISSRGSTPFAFAWSMSQIVVQVFGDSYRSWLLIRPVHSSGSWRSGWNCIAKSRPQGWISPFPWSLSRQSNRYLRSTRSSGR